MEPAEEKDTFKNIFVVSRRAFLFAWHRERKLLILTFLLGIFSATIIYLQFSSFSNIVNEIIISNNLHLGITHNLIRQAMLLGVSFLLPALLQSLQSKYNDALVIRLVSSIQLYLAEKFSSLDVGTIESTEFQSKFELTQKWGIGSISNVVRNSRKLVSDIAGAVTAGLVLVSISPFLLLLAILGSIAYYFVENKYGRELFLLYQTSNDDNRIEESYYQYFREPKKLIEVLLFNTGNYLRSQMRKIMQKNDANLIRVKGKESFATFGADIIQTLCLFVAIFFVTFETLHGKLLVGSLLLAFTVYRSFVNTSQTFFSDFAFQQDQVRFAKRWFDIFDIKSQIVNKPTALKVTYATPPTIEFKNVSFKYPDTNEMVLKNLSLKLQPGEKLAIVGENGAGKTTLIKLLSRVYDPTKGKILIDGVDLKDIDLVSWQQHLGILLQEFTNYRMTAREAIAISRPDEVLNEEKVKSAAVLAGADGFIQKLPKKYNQLLWKGFKDGVELSKGQFQRMAVARIFYRDALISVLDEPTSAIDAVAEEKIFEVLETKMQGKTVVLISHRFSTVKNADKIAVIEHGELKELGNHKELMEKSGRYAELYTMQAKRYLESE